jgi:hypothetical protein
VIAKTWRAVVLFGVCHDEVDWLTGIEHHDLERVAVVKAGTHSRGLEDLRRRQREVFQFSGIHRGVIAVIHGQKRVAFFVKQDHMFAAFRRCRRRPFEAERGVGADNALDCVRCRADQGDMDTGTRVSHRSCSW